MVVSLMLLCLVLRFDVFESTIEFTLHESPMLYIFVWQIVLLSSLEGLDCKAVDRCYHAWNMRWKHWYMYILEYRGVTSRLLLVSQLSCMIFSFSWELPQLHRGREMWGFFYPFQNCITDSHVTIFFLGKVETGCC